MMYKKINENINNIHSFLIYQGSVICLQHTEKNLETRIVKITEKGSIETSAKSFKLSQIFPLNESKFIGKKLSDGQSILFDYRFNKIGESHFLYEKIIHTKGVGFAHIKINKQKKFCCVQLETQTELWRLDYSCRQSQIFKDKIYVERYLPGISSTLFCLDIRSGTTIWEINTSKLIRKGLVTDVARILGVFNECVLIVLQLENKQIIAELNIVDGTLLRYWESLPNFQSWSEFKYTAIPAPKQSYLNQEKGILSGLSRYYYWEIDLNTKSLSFYDLTEEFKKQKINVITSGHVNGQGSYLYFCSDHFEESEHGEVIDTYKIGAFNMETRKVDWAYTFDFDPGVAFKSPAPVVEGGRLFVLDTKGTLHIFEREPD